MLDTTRLQLAVARRTQAQHALEKAEAELRGAEEAHEQALNVRDAAEGAVQGAASVLIWYAERSLKA